MDRNRRHEDGSLRLDTSLSARRAWIEMPPGLACSAICTVALRKESVDRNVNDDDEHTVLDVSLSARRAWIEIVHLNALDGESASLSARRAWIEITLSLQTSPGWLCRSPQGERG